MIARSWRITILFLCCAAAMPSMAQQTREERQNRVPWVRDWTSRHMIYSAPHTAFQSLRLQRDSRYIQQYWSRHIGYRRSFEHSKRHHSRPQLPGASDLQRDWALPLSADFTMGDANFPAKYTFDVTAAPSCANDFVVFTNSKKSIDDSNVTIYGVNQLYVNSAGNGLCSGTAPNVLWAYTFYSNPDGGAVIGSPVLSFDGTQVVWMESKGNGVAATLHILRPYTGGGAGTLTSPATLADSTSASAYHTCTPTAGSNSAGNQGGCLYSIPLADGDDDKNSSPYYDYNNDVLYVGDAEGVLHLFTGVFKGVPTEVTTQGWPVTVDSGAALTDPVFDIVSEHVLVGDSSGILSYVAVNGSLTGGTSAALGGNTWRVGTSISNDGLIVDGATQRVFVFASDTGTGVVVGEDDTSLNTGLGVRVGPVNVGSSTSSTLHSGAFDNGYYTTDTTLSAASGNLYVCGNSGAANLPTLFRISVSSGLISTSAPHNEFTAATSGTDCSPVTEFYNPNANEGLGKDSIFFSVHANAPATTNCSGDGCVFAATLTETGSSQIVTVSGALPASNGASGIIVDNDGTSNGTNNLYYIWLGNSNSTYSCDGNTSGSACAVQITQAGLGSQGNIIAMESTDSGAVTSSTAFYNSTASNPPMVAGDLLLVFSHWDQANGPAVTASVSDGLGNTYFPIGSAIEIGIFGPATHWVQAWYAINNQARASGNSDPVRVTFTSTTLTISTVDVFEISGLDSAAPLDVYTTGTGSGSAISIGPTPTTNFDNETIIQLVGFNANSFGYVAGPGYVNFVGQEATTYGEVQSVATKGSFTATASTTNSASWAGYLIGFKNAVQ
ncbi:MAG: hypothetical protein ACRD4Y_15735 [Candidatus Acidiferrales bacterium]